MLYLNLHFIVTTVADPIGGGGGEGSNGVPPFYDPGYAPALQCRRILASQIMGRIASRDFLMWKLTALDLVCCMSN